MATTHVDRLIDHLTDGGTDALTADLRAWIEQSRRFRAFAEAHRDKIRKKVRSAGGADPRLDLRAELAVAHALLVDRRIELGYEGYGSTVGGPDYTVSFRSHVACNLEVTRWRGDPGSLRRLLIAKLHQLPPGVANAVLVAVDVPEGLPDLEALMEEVRNRVRADSAASDAGATGDARARLRRLSGIFAWAERRSGAERATLWTSPTARIALPTPAARAILTTLRDAPTLPTGPPTAAPM